MILKKIVQIMPLTVREEVRIGLLPYKILNILPMRKNKNFLNQNKYLQIFAFRKGFTLIELVVVFSVIAVLSTIGIASFVNYSKAQSLSGAVSDFQSTLNDAKSRALSQVKPAECTSALSGYWVEIIDNKNYKLSAICQTQQVDINKPILLPSNIQFNLAVGQTTTTKIFFPIISSGVEGSGVVVITGYGQSKTITIDNSGNIK